MNLKDARDLVVDLGGWLKGQKFESRDPNRDEVLRLLRDVVKRLNYEEMIRGAAKDELHTKHAG